MGDLYICGMKSALLWLRPNAGTVAYLMAENEIQEKGLASLFRLKGSLRDIPAFEADIDEEVCDDQ